MTVAILSFVLEALIIFRAKRGGFLSHFPLFYSYIGFIFCGSATVYFLISHLWPQHYASSYWFYFLVTVVVEFAVLLEASDHIFKPYPSIRHLGRFLIFCISAVFFFVYILPALMQQQPSNVMILELVKRASLTKGVIILALLAAVRYFRLPLGRNISGILLGLALYLATNMANTALAEHFGYALYFRTFAVVLPLSYTLGLTMWTITLWRYEPALEVIRRIPKRPEGYSESLSDLLVRLNSTLTRLLGK